MENFKDKVAVVTGVASLKKKVQREGRLYGEWFSMVPRR